MAKKEMNQKIFWEIFYKDDTREFEIKGSSVNDTDFTNKVWEMQQRGCTVHCSTPPCELSRENIINDMKQRGFKHVEGLFYDTYFNRKKPESGKDRV
jgi:hypothetical protein